MLTRLWLNIEYRWHMVDAYLFSHRGMFVEASDAECRAYEAQRKLSHIRLNKLYGGMR